MKQHQNLFFTIVDHEKSFAQNSFIVDFMKSEYTRMDNACGRENVSKMQVTRG